MSTAAVPRQPSNKAMRWLLREWRMRKYLYLMSLPVLAFFVIFRYIPMYGVVIAFKRFVPRQGIFGSKWVGLGQFMDFFSSFYAGRIVRNTIMLSAYSILFNFPAPILLALMLNEVRHAGYRKTIQTITYMPYFISLVVVCGLIRDFSAQKGVLWAILNQINGVDRSLLAIPGMYRSIYITTDTWQYIGFNSIIYIAAISAVDAELYDAGAIDGIVTRVQRIRYITLPSIMPTITILFILQLGNLMNVGYEKTILLYNDQIMEVSDLISSFVYRKGLQEANYSYAAAVGLFNSVINSLLLVIANTVSRRVSGNSLW